MLARLHDGNLLVVSPDAGTAAVSPLLARMVETAREDGEPDDRRDVALRLLDLATHGDALTPSEEVYCARHGAVEAGSPRAATLAALLPRAALSLARSSTPRDALAIVARMSEPDADLRASAAVILARIALDDHDAAARALEILPRPATAVERELALHVVVRTLCATCAGLDAARTRLREVIEWAPDDDDWRTRVAHAEAMLALPHGASFPERASASAADTPRPDAEAFDDALRAATAAAGGETARARALLSGRQATHGWHVESDLTMFLLHAHTMVTIGEDLDVVESATRRRLLSARWADNQDEIAVLALLDATVQILRMRPRSPSTAFRFRASPRRSRCGSGSTRCARRPSSPAATSCTRVRRSHASTPHPRGGNGGRSSCCARRCARGSRPPPAGPTPP